MTTRLILNIGLSSKAYGKQNPLAILNALNGRGFDVKSAAIASSTCEDGIEKCLVVAVTCDSGLAGVYDSLFALAVDYGQDCIACVIGESGFHIGPKPYATFDLNLFKVKGEAPIV